MESSIGSCTVDDVPSSMEEALLEKPLLMMDLLMEEEEEEEEEDPSGTIDPLSDCNSSRSHILYEEGRKGMSIGKESRDQHISIIIVNINNNNNNNIITIAIITHYHQCRIELT